MNPFQSTGVAGLGESLQNIKKNRVSFVDQKEGSNTSFTNRIATMKMTRNPTSPSSSIASPDDSPKVSMLSRQSTLSQNESASASLTSLGQQQSLQQRVESRKNLFKDRTIKREDSLEVDLGSREAPLRRSSEKIPLTRLQAADNSEAKAQRRTSDILANRENQAEENLDEIALSRNISTSNNVQPHFRMGRKISFNNLQDGGGGGSDDDANSVGSYSSSIGSSIFSTTAGKKKQQKKGNSWQLAMVKAQVRKEAITKLQRWWRRVLANYERDMEGRLMGPKADPWKALLIATTDIIKQQDLEMLNKRAALGEMGDEWQLDGERVAEVWAVWWRDFNLDMKGFMLEDEFKMMVMEAMKAHFPIYHLNKMEQRYNYTFEYHGQMWNQDYFRKMSEIYWKEMAKGYPLLKFNHFVKGMVTFLEDWCMFRSQDAAIQHLQPIYERVKQSLWPKRFEWLRQGIPKLEGLLLTYDPGMVSLMAGDTELNKSEGPVVPAMMDTGAEKKESPKKKGIELFRAGGDAVKMLAALRTVNEDGSVSYKIKLDSADETPKLPTLKDDVNEGIEKLRKFLERNKDKESVHKRRASLRMEEGKAWGAAPSRWAEPTEEEKAEQERLAKEAAERELKAAEEKRQREVERIAAMRYKDGVGFGSSANRTQSRLSIIKQVEDEQILKAKRDAERAALRRMSTGSYDKKNSEKDTHFSKVKAKPRQISPPRIQCEWEGPLHHRVVCPRCEANKSLAKEVKRPKTQENPNRPAMVLHEAYSALYTKNPVNSSLQATSVGSDPHWHSAAGGAGTIPSKESLREGRSLIEFYQRDPPRSPGEGAFPPSSPTHTRPGSQKGSPRIRPAPEGSPSRRNHQHQQRDHNFGIFSQSSLTPDASPNSSPPHRIPSSVNKKHRGCPDCDANVPHRHPWDVQEDDKNTAQQESSAPATNLSGGFQSRRSHPDLNDQNYYKTIQHANRQADLNEVVQGQPLTNFRRSQGSVEDSMKDVLEQAVLRASQDYKYKKAVDEEKLQKPESELTHEDLGLSVSTMSPTQFPGGRPARERYPSEPDRKVAKDYGPANWKNRKMFDIPCLKTPRQVVKLPERKPHAPLKNAMPGTTSLEADYDIRALRRPSFSQAQQQRLTEYIQQARQFALLPKSVYRAQSTTVFKVADGMDAEEEEAMLEAWKRSLQEMKRRSMKAQSGVAVRSSLEGQQQKQQQRQQQQSEGLGSPKSAGADPKRTMRSRQAASHLRATAPELHSGGGQADNIFHLGPDLAATVPSEMSITPRLSFRNENLNQSVSHLRSSFPGPESGPPTARHGNEESFGVHKLRQSGGGLGITSPPPAAVPANANVRKSAEWKHPARHDTSLEWDPPTSASGLCPVAIQDTPPLLPEFCPPEIDRTKPSRSSRTRSSAKKSTTSSRRPGTGHSTVSLLGRVASGPPTDHPNFAEFHFNPDVLLTRPGTSPNMQGRPGSRDSYSNLGSNSRSSRPGIQATSTGSNVTRTNWGDESSILGVGPIFQSFSSNPKHHPAHETRRSKPEKANVGLSSSQAHGVRRAPASERGPSVSRPFGKVSSSGIKQGEVKGSPGLSSWDEENNSFPGSPIPFPLSLADSSCPPNCPDGFAHAHVMGQGRFAGSVVIAQGGQTGAMIGGVAPAGGWGTKSQISPGSTRKAKSSPLQMKSTKSQHNSHGVSSELTSLVSSISVVIPNPNQMVEA